MYLWSLWAKHINIIVSYNNAFSILYNISFMFATAAVDSRKTRIRKCIYSLMSRLSTSTNLTVQYTLNSDVYTTSDLHITC